jgi:hypothetical protein
MSISFPNQVSAAEKCVSTMMDCDEAEMGHTPSALVGGGVGGCVGHSISLNSGSLSHNDQTLMTARSASCAAGSASVTCGGGGRLAVPERGLDNGFDPSFAPPGGDFQAQNSFSVSSSISSIVLKPAWLNALVCAIAQAHA